MAFLQFDETHLIGKGANVYWAPYSQALPAFPSDIFDGVSPYAVKTGWNLFGATSGPPVISREITTAGFTIQQTDTTLLEEPTEMNRRLTVPVAEFSPENLALIEESTAVTYTGATKRGPGTKIPFGTINSFSSFRLALFVQKSKQQGVNLEGATGNSRGAFFGWTAFKASFVGDTLSTSIAKGTLGDLSVTFKLYPDPTVTTLNGDMGLWFIENGDVTVATS